MKVNTTYVSWKHGTQQFISAHDDTETRLTVTVKFLPLFKNKSDKNEFKT